MPAFTQWGGHKAPVAQTPDFVGAAAADQKHARLVAAAKAQQRMDLMKGTMDVGGQVYDKTGWSPIDMAKWGKAKLGKDQEGADAIVQENKDQIAKWAEDKRIASGGQPAPQPTPSTPPTQAPVPGGGMAGEGVGGAMKGITPGTPPIPAAAPQAAQAMNMAGGAAGAGGVGTAATMRGVAAGASHLAPAAAMAGGGAGNAAAAAAAAKSAAAAGTAATAAAPAAATAGGTAATGGLMAAGMSNPIGWAALAALAAYGLLSEEGGMLS